MSKAGVPRTDDLVAGLTGVLPGAVAGVERRPHAYRTSFAVEELAVTLADGATLELVFKDVGRGALAEGARDVKPDFVHDPLREIEVYRSVLSRHAFGAPALYGAVVEPERGTFWLFLEKVEGVPLWEVGDLRVWSDAARWLAVLHERVEVPAHVPLLEYSDDFYRTWLTRARRSVDAPELEAIAAAYDDVVRRLAALPRTFLHGEFYPSNILVEERDGDVRICPVDWEMAAAGPAFVDLAALTTGKWSDAEREELEAAYYRALGEPPPRQEFAVALECCRLHIALQWLGWSPGWIPPPEHRQDWLAEAVRAARNLNLGLA